MTPPQAYIQFDDEFVIVEANCRYVDYGLEVLPVSGRIWLEPIEDEE